MGPFSGYLRVKNSSHRTENGYRRVFLHYTLGSKKELKFESNSLNGILAKPHFSKSKTILDKQPTKSPSSSNDWQWMEAKYSKNL